MGQRLGSISFHKCLSGWAAKCEAWHAEQMYLIHPYVYTCTHINAVYIYIHVDLYEIIYVYMYTYMYISCIHTCIHKLHICILSNQHLGTKRKKTFDERRKTSQLSSLFSAGRGPIPWAQKWGHEFGCWASYTQLFGPEFGHPFAAARHKQERSVRAATTDPLVWAHPFPMTNLVILKRRRRRRPSSTKNSCLELPRRG